MKTQNGTDSHCTESVVAAFLIAVEKGAILGCNDWQVYHAFGAAMYTCYACRERMFTSCLRCLTIRVWYLLAQSDFERPLGAPLGPPTTDDAGVIMRRAFQGGAKVTFNLTSATGRIVWPAP